jgi:hypothetical protein
MAMRPYDVQSFAPEAGTDSVRVRATATSWLPAVDLRNQPILPLHPSHVRQAPLGDHI